MISHVLVKDTSCLKVRTSYKCFVKYFPKCSVRSSFHSYDELAFSRRLYNLPRTLLNSRYYSNHSHGLVHGSKSPPSSQFLVPSFLQFNGQLKALCNNSAFQALPIKLSDLQKHWPSLKPHPLPPKRVSLGIPSISNPPVDTVISDSPTSPHPPSFVQPHPPYGIFAAPILDVRVLTNPGAVKRTYNLCLDISKYPLLEGKDWKIGGSFGIMPPNSDAEVLHLAHLLKIPQHELYVTKVLRTNGGRWPTIWGEDKPRCLYTSLYHIFKWCSDFISKPPTKSLFRLLAEHTLNPVEKSVLLALSDFRQDESYCRICTQSCVTLPDILEAFPSCHPPVDHLISALPQLMPRWYSISNDPSLANKRLEMAFTVQEYHSPNGQSRTGICTGFLEDLALAFLKARHDGSLANKKFTVPMFRGVQQNPFAKEFHNDGPMCLIGAGVGIAPFRGFVQRRLANAACTGKVWIIQGCRDQKLDELYHGEWNTVPGHHKNPKCRAKKLVVESRNGRREYVQDAVRRHGDVIWDVLSHKNGRIYLCGSGNSFVSEIEKALMDVAMKYGKLSKEEAQKELENWQKPLNCKLIKEVW